MNEIVKHTCEEMSKGSMFHRSTCGRGALFHERNWNGQMAWFCGTHAPSERQKRQITSDLKAKPVRDARAARWRMNAASPEMLSALKYALNCFDRESCDPMVTLDPVQVIAQIKHAIEKAEGR